MRQNSLSSRLVGYARVSTGGQDLAYQLERLRSAGCRRIFHEKRSGKNTTDRPELHKLLRLLKPGDVLLATVSDRVARDPMDMLTILNSVKASGAGLRLLDEPFIDTTSELADLFLFILGWFARWHRLRILENTAHGREMARRRGVKFGRKPKLGPSDRKIVVERLSNGEPCAQIARAFGVSKSTILRIR
ncbi:recombinase family protein [Rhizobium viscosum]|uniref:DNA invertase Pin-like site-specific DNA recombinase n=1 Tax=Rhizobium viscosum TaxID=1673 RepID=A0ABR9IIS5_RHIVS|nr:recombinase family protein [Rhizobium viscosum]MBE1503087.1 DNA invertase Pin-like site-specific DNA recombinase [Rhizobium viscosum]